MTANKYHNCQHSRGLVICYSGSQRGGCETAFTAVAPEGDGLTGREGLLLLKGSWIDSLVKISVLMVQSPPNSASRWGPGFEHVSLRREVGCDRTHSQTVAYSW